MAAENYNSSDNTKSLLRKLVRNTYELTQVADSAPVNTSAPTITPVDVSVGELVTCFRGFWTDFPTSYDYQWMQDGSPIGGANSSTYTAQLADVGTVLSCEVTANNSFGASDPEISNNSNPVSSDSYFLLDNGTDFLLLDDGASLLILA